MEYRVDKEWMGKRLSRLLKHKMDVSLELVQRHLANGAIALNGKIERFGSYRVQLGDCLEVGKAALAQKPPSSIDILYEDAHLLICNKPHGTASCPDFFRRVWNLPHLRLAHRLDKETSGCLILTKSSEMEKQMQAVFYKRKICKEYFAQVEGEFLEEYKKITFPIGLKDQFHGGKRYQVSARGKPCETHFRCIERNKETSLLQCVPRTGRTHQIRVHLSAIHHPILGDCLYNSHVNIYERMFLHAHSLTFFHPQTQKKIEVVAPMPTGFFTACASRR